MRLKSREKWPPHGFTLLLPEIGMKSPLTGSFNEMVDAFSRIVQKNPALAQKHNWPTYREAQEDWLDEREAQRMVAHGWFNFVIMEGSPPSFQKKTSLVARVGNVAGAAKTALAIYSDLFGPGGDVVAKEEAERRAAICVKCPKHDAVGGLKKYFIKAAANELMAVFAMLKSKDITTSLDDQLGVCQVCECPMRAKVFIEAHVLKKHLKPDQIAKLDSKCWIPPAIA